MNTSDIDLMLAEKGNPCISIVIPTHQYSKDRLQNPLIFEKAINKAKKLLANSAWPQEKIKQLSEKFNAVLENMDYMRLQEGLALFVSPNILKIHLLPFPVKEKVMLAQTFEIRDIIYFNQLLTPYYLMAISKKRIRLFKGSGRDLQEVVNNDFPMQYVEEYEYAHPSLGSPISAGLKAFERDKSIVQENRMQTFLRDADESLHKYLKDDMILFVAGVEEAISNFKEVSHHTNKLAATISGNYDLDALHPLAETTWKKVKEAVHATHQKLLKKLEEDYGRQLAVVGIRNVWRAASEGKGMVLLVEKDYQVMAYQNPQNKSEIYLTPPAEKYDIIIDAADDVIEIVKEKGGTVEIVENGQLDNFQHIGMLVRY